MYKCALAHVINVCSYHLSHLALEIRSSTRLLYYHAPAMNRYRFFKSIFLIKSYIESENVPGLFELDNCFYEIRWKCGIFITFIIMYVSFGNFSHDLLEFWPKIKSIPFIIRVFPPFAHGNTWVQATIMKHQKLKREMSMVSFHLWLYIRLWGFFSANEGNGRVKSVNHKYRFINLIDKAHNFSWYWIFIQIK